MAALLIDGTDGFANPQAVDWFTDYAALIAIGFLIYGPVMLIGVHALDLVPKKAAGTAAESAAHDAWSSRSSRTPSTARWPSRPAWTHAATAASARRRSGSGG